ncbi:MAG: murein peptide amidase [Humisphaera sp.]|nr:murein peptide amidase [Humisphaera sp.]
MKRLLFVFFVLTGCASHFPEKTSPALPAPAPARSTSRVMPQTIGHSVMGRPIEMYSFGAVEGGRPVIVMGAIHGNETASADVSRGLLAELMSDSRAATNGVGGVPVVVIPVANPDGLAAGTRTNANKIDVNRNFPSQNWGQRPRGRKFLGGQTPASEPETIALMNTIERLRPRLIITVHSIGDGKHCNNYDGPASAIAEAMSRENGYPAVPTIGYPTPGSLGNWGGNDRQIPMITLELPRVLPGPRAWPDNRAAVYAAIQAAK